MIIRKATRDDMPYLLRMYAQARTYMEQEGNPTQWAGGYPAPELLESDIAQGKLYVCDRGPQMFAYSEMLEPAETNAAGCDVDGMLQTAIDELARLEQEAAEQEQSFGSLMGAFYFAIEPEPTYAQIDGAWQNDEPYGVIHRIAVGVHKQGVASYCIDWAQSKTRAAGAAGGIRIDTHADNAPMLGLLSKMGFVTCGGVVMEDGTPRTAFQRVN